MNAFSKCSVCVDPESSENPIFVCVSCKLNVHAFCYGIDAEEESGSNWTCSPCKEGVVGTIRCEFCPKTCGAFKKTSRGKWIHVICALFTDGVKIEDDNSMEPVKISQVSRTKRNKICAFCSSKQGVCSLCSKSKCEHRIHITCAQANNCLEEVVSKRDNSIKKASNQNDSHDVLNDIETNRIRKIAHKNNCRQKGKKAAGGR